MSGILNRFLSLFLGLSIEHIMEKNLLPYLFDFIFWTLRP